MPDEKPKPQGSTPKPETPAVTNGHAEGSLLDKIILEGKMARDEAQKPYARDLLSEFVGQVVDEGMTVSKDTITSIKSRIAQIDELLSQQLNEIMHHSDFQTIEASWRGLLYLVKNAETGS